VYLINLPLKQPKFPDLAASTKRNPIPWGAYGPLYAMNRSAAPESDFHLLHHDHHQLIQRYQGMIDYVVFTFVQKGGIPVEEKADTVQTIVEQLLTHKLERMKTQFRQEAQFKTYFMATVQNMCRNIARERAVKSKQTVPLDVSHHAVRTDASQPDELLIITQELQRLELILRTYKKRQRLHWCLIFAYRIPFNPQDAFHFFDLSSPVEQETFVLEFYQPYTSLTDQQLYQLLNPYFNRIEHKDSTYHALIKWTTNHIHELIQLLNDSVLGCQYDNETLGILLHKFFSQREPIAIQFNPNSIS
jgi:DNA-directed RNA polymerase specialized sigma24 family protein